MLETLAGRLKWERTPDSIRVRIPCWQNPHFIVFCFVIGAWAFVPVCWILFSPKIRLLSGFGVIFLALECFVVCSLIWRFNAKTVLLFGPRATEIRRKIFGIRVRMHTYETVSLMDLRYVPGTPGYVRFERLGVTHRFAKGIRDSEALALIDKMLDVYTIPSGVPATPAPTAPRKATLRIGQDYYESASGRLEFKQTADGFRVQIPPRFDLQAVFWAFVATMWGLAGVNYLLSLLAGRATMQGWLPPSLDFLLGMGFLLAWFCSRKTALTLSTHQLRIEYWALGMRLRSRVFSVESVENFRYVQSSGFGFWSFFMKRTYVPSSIRFEDDSETRVFAKGIAEEEAAFLIDRMFEVYEFRKSRSMAYMGEIK
jgi:hypothetical protein